MLFNLVTFNVITNAIAIKDRAYPADGDQTTVVTLTPSDVPDNIVADALISGQSPRVRFGGSWRKNGIPPEVKMSWADWLGRPNVVANKPETDESIAARAKSDPDFKKRMLEMLAAQDRD